MVPFAVAREPVASAWRRVPRKAFWIPCASGSPAQKTGMTHTDGPNGATETITALDPLLAAVIAALRRIEQRLREAADDDVSIDASVEDAA
jgi:hypothetical protein